MLPVFSSSFWGTLPGKSIRLWLYPYNYNYDNDNSNNLNNNNITNIDDNFNDNDNNKSNDKIFELTDYLCRVGLLVMCVALLVGVLLSRKLKHIQERLLKQKDSRMEVINEVLNSIKVIKLFAWENKFVNKVISKCQ